MVCFSFEGGKNFSVLEAIRMGLSFLEKSNMSILELYFLTKEKVFPQLQEVLGKAFVYFRVGNQSESKYCNNQKK